MSKQRVYEDLAERFEGITAADHCRQIMGSSASDGGRCYLASLHNRPGQPEVFKIDRLARDGQGHGSEEVYEVPEDIEWS